MLKLVTGGKLSSCQYQVFWESGAALAQVPGLLHCCVVAEREDQVTGLGHGPTARAQLAVIWLNQHHSPGGTIVLC